MITDATVADGARVGPFAHLRPGAASARTRTSATSSSSRRRRSAPGSKANHLAYLGDATIGADVNVGAGTITCNYDGAAKHQTVIEDGVVHRQQFDAGGAGDASARAPMSRPASAITDDVPGGRARDRARRGRRTRAGWVEKRKSVSSSQSVDSSNGAKAVLAQLILGT